MSRPLSTWRAEQLEEFFRSKRSEKGALEKLEHELSFRQTARAKSLLDIVRAALRALSKQEVAQPNAFALEPSPAVTETYDRAKQGRLWAAPSQNKEAAPSSPVPASSPKSPLSLVTGETVPASEKGSDVAPAVSSEVVEATAAPVIAKKPTTKQSASDDNSVVFAMTTDEAYKELKVQPSASWELIEQSRRKIVQKGSPALTRSLTSEQRERLDETARRANAAFRLLANLRTYH